MTSQEEAFFELLLTYPSPHNGQPMVCSRSVENTYEVLFQTDRGLTATPISYLFSFVTIGVFFEYVKACGKALGHEVTIAEALPPQTDMAKRGAELRCGSMTIQWGSTPPDTALETAIRTRQTSRKKYTAGLTAETRRQLLPLIAPRQQLIFLNDTQAHQAVWLNQRAVFDDMFNDPVRIELTHWLRTSHSEKITKKDGLSYDCMELSGASLRFILRHYKILRWPGLSGLLKQYYLRTMKDSSTVAYLSSPFTKEAEAVEIGRSITKMWLELSHQGLYLHPFGTIVSNDEAHRDFVELANIQHETQAENYVVFIFRAGQSNKPVKSERIGISHLVRE